MSRDKREESKEKDHETACAAARSHHERLALPKPPGHAGA
jgi:hypothetical protein